MALLMSLDVWHREVVPFIQIKENPEEITNANLSVEIDDHFMDNLGHEVFIKTRYGNNEIGYTVNTTKVFDAICQSAWKSAEPGIIFTNKFRNYNLMEYISDYSIETCNPLNL